MDLPIKFNGDVPLRYVDVYPRGVDQATLEKCVSSRQGNFWTLAFDEKWVITEVRTRGVLWM